MTMLDMKKEKIEMLRKNTFKFKIQNSFAFWNFKKKTRTFIDVAWVIITSWPNCIILYICMLKYVVFMPEENVEYNIF